MVATRAQKAAVTAARPGARLDRLPVDLLAHIALYTGKYDEDFSSTADALHDLLALRCVCRACEPAVSRAATDHELVKHWVFKNDEAQSSITNFGKVFGSGCRQLDLSTVGKESHHMLSAFRGLVVHTQGRLLGLDISSESFWGVGRAFVLELCGLCPQLKELDVGWLDVGGATSASVSGFCEELSRSCPLLERVDLIHKRTYGPLLGIAPAESYQIHFPAIKTLDFNVVSREGYEPTRYDRIEATLETCVKVDAVNLSCCTVSPALMDLLLRTPLKSRLRTLDFDYATTVSSETILRCAAGFEALCDLRLPEYSSSDPEFYRSLARARPTITALNLGFRCHADDACLRMVCELLSLERLEITLMESLTPAAIDIIVDSPTGRTLRYFNAYETPIITAATMLRLVRGCTLLNELEWSSSERLSPIEDGPTIDSINELLKSRGGKELDDPFVEFGPSTWGRSAPGEESGEDSGEESGEESGEDSEDGGDGMNPNPIEESSLVDDGSLSGDDWLPL
jgi:hypothetical protein